MCSSDLRRSQPLLDPNLEFGRMPAPIHLFHGRGDRLVPYTESLRFRQRLPEELDADVTITGLFAHSADHRPAALSERIGESYAFLNALRKALDRVG